MAYSITTKDGITINNIPDDVAADSADLKARVAAIRSGGGAAALETAAIPAPAETTLQGITGAITRGIAPIAAGATLGACRSRRRRPCNDCWRSYCWLNQ